MKLLSVAAAAAALMGASVAWASTATADDLTGTYTVLAQFGDGGTDTTTWQLSTCGPDCRTLTWAVLPAQRLQLHTTSWTGTDDTGCTTILDTDTLAGTWQCPGDAVPVRIHATPITGTGPGV